MTHPYLTEWRESHLATWRPIDLNPDYTEPIHLQRPDTPQNAAAQHPPMGAAGAAPRASLDRADPRGITGERNRTQRVAHPSKPQA